MAMNSPVDMGASPNPAGVFGGFGGAAAAPVAPSFPSMPALAPAPAPAAAAPAGAGFTFGATQPAPAPAMTFGGGGFGGELREAHDTSNTTHPKYPLINSPNYAYPPRHSSCARVPDGCHAARCPTCCTSRPGGWRLLDGSRKLKAGQRGAPADHEGQATDEIIRSDSSTSLNSGPDPGLDWASATLMDHYERALYPKT